MRLPTKLPLSPEVIEQVSEAHLPGLVDLVTRSQDMFLAIRAEALDTDPLDVESLKSFRRYCLDTIRQLLPDKKIPV